MGSGLTFYLILYCFSLTATALFAYLEAVCTALRLFEINQLETLNPRYQKLFAIWRSQPQRLLVTILIANNFSDTLTSVLFTEIMRRMIGGELGFAIGVFCATIIILFFGSIFPKSLGRARSGTISPFILSVVNTLVNFLSPIVTMVMSVGTPLTKFFGGNSEVAAVTEQEIEFLIDYSDEKGIMPADKTAMLQKVFDLGETTVRSIMVIREKMVTLDVNTPWSKAREFFLTTYYSRVPVYDGELDAIIGFIHQKDIFFRAYKDEEVTLRELVRPIIIVADTEKSSYLLKEFLKNTRHIAIIKDEGDHVVGLVTLEDVLEELVGEIFDEHEPAV